MRDLDHRAPTASACCCTSPTFPERTSDRVIIALGSPVDDLPARTRRVRSPDGQSGQQLFVDTHAASRGSAIGVNLRAYDVGYIEAFPLDTTEKHPAGPRDRPDRRHGPRHGASRPSSDGRPADGCSGPSRVSPTPPARSRPARSVPAWTTRTTLTSTGSPGSFNDMADAVQERIEREQRFASDVSHELRSPITALTAAVEVLDAKRDDLPDRTQAGARRRRQSGPPIRRHGHRPARTLAARSRRTKIYTASPVDIVELCDRVSQRYGLRRPADRGAPHAPSDKRLIDRVRFERILGNLLDNATQPRRRARRASRSNRRPKRSAR